MKCQPELTSVVPPQMFPLEEDQLFPKELACNGKRIPDTSLLQKHLELGGLITEKAALLLINDAALLFADEPNVLHLQDPITISGDIHGQYYDLLTLLCMGGDPSMTQYLFLGDYVDRGLFSCEVTLLLFAFKIRYPKTFWMLRGNHECHSLSYNFTFHDECVHKYGETVYNAFQTAFDRLPLAAVVSSVFLCVHGGISPDIKTVDDINDIDRVREPPKSGPMCDLLWSDPMEEEEEEMFPDVLFLDNKIRGCSFVFSSIAVERFLAVNNLIGVIRAHKAQFEGFRMFRKVEETEFPSVISIFSAPNYCGTYDNRGSILQINKKVLRVRQFSAVTHPYVLPDFMNAFTWSLPFLFKKLEEILQIIMVEDQVPLNTCVIKIS
ncbi:putative serine/threonine protein phosphatase [Trypanosoma theileri]|uniref:Serine/threonine-protein phosphatase n=1 Tax=Trypanosoma theileri TaxID=67003 RepID=A0A1X0P6J3_9TRYP|nr:putative serine/threonine protein phosphatase [Trypanosoma theileri]ORC92263.1 putative serine/threonine protein phosphatase [Trypanosoma theileri]